MSENRMRISPYDQKDEAQLFALLEREGTEWSDYWRGKGKEKYRKALASSIVYLVFIEEEVCGYIRCRDDDGFGIYIYDLLVDKTHRGKAFGRLLMEQVSRDFCDDLVYVLGDNYQYYETLGYTVEGKIYVVKPKKQ